MKVLTLVLHYSDFSDSLEVLRRKQSLPRNDIYFSVILVFPDGHYPTDYPPHPAPPPSESHARMRDFDMNKRPSADQLRMYNREIELRNNQRKPVAVDFGDISKVIRGLSFDLV